MKDKPLIEKAMQSGAIYIGSYKFYFRDVQEALGKAEKRLKEFIDNGEEKYPEIEVEETEQISFLEETKEFVNKVWKEEFGDFK